MIEPGSRSGLQTVLTVAWRREELFHLQRSYGLTDAPAAEKAKLGALYEKEDRELGRRGKPLERLWRSRPHRLTERYPPKADSQFDEMAELFGAVARSAPDGRRNNERPAPRGQLMNAGNRKQMQLPSQVLLALLRPRGSSLPRRM